MTIFQKIHCWFMKRSVVELIAIVFTYITIINSIMMVVGFDKPKEGVFAYVHLMSRLVIIIVVIGIWEYKEIMSVFKSWVEKKTITNAHKSREFITLSKKKVFQTYVSSISLYFTLTTLFISIVNIIFQRMVDPLGGAELYRNLLIIYGAISLGGLFLPINKLFVANGKKH